ncbi:MAG: Uma2 family endonuclease [Chloroflexota bacterium]|nr:MAG: Uma2 family endonuclease [Chloroflexota bacterium]
MAISRRQLSLEQFLQLPEEEPALEYEEGQVERKMTPKLRHSALHSELLIRLTATARRRNRARVCVDLRTTFGGRSYVPDLSVFLTVRVPHQPDGALVDDVLLPPDIAVEIISPDQRLSRLIRRCTWYVENGVCVALLVVPDDESVLVFRPGRPVQVVRSDERVELEDVLPGFSLTARRLFAALRLGR